MAKKIILFFVAALSGGLISLGVYKAFENDEIKGEKAEPLSYKTTYDVKTINVPSFNFAEVSKLVNPTVVHIKTTIAQSEGNSPFDFFGQMIPEYLRQGSGSGVIIGEDGYIVTNNHVIENAKEVEVTLYDKRVFTASVVGTDPSTDLALVKISADDLPSIQYGNSDKIEVGEWVLAVGNPFNLTSTVTAGIVSAKARSINLLGGGSNIESFIQTDAAVNPGNSGGALVNIEGKLVGINTAIASKTGQYAGYSFAVPVNIVQKVVTDLKEYGEVQRAFIGVSIQNVDEEIAEEENLDKIRGVYVESVMPESGAQEAGLQQSDIIISVNGNKTNTVPELQEIIGRKRPGDKVQLTFIRNGDEKTLDVVLKGKDGSTKITKTEKPDVEELLGAELAKADSDKLDELDLESGVEVKDLKEGKLKEVGMKEGFIITHINKQEVGSPDDIARLMANIDGGILIEGRHKDGSKGYYGFGMNE